MIVETPIGNLRFVAYADGEPLGATVATFRCGVLEPILPLGMSVTRSVGVMVAVHPQVTMQNFQVRALWTEEPPTNASPSSGERLDAQEWVGGGHIVVLGTEDGEALEDRLTEHGLLPDTYPVSNLPVGLEVTLPQVPAGFTTTLHFIVAINTHPEPVDCSAWFAADVPHERVHRVLSGS